MACDLRDRALRGPVRDAVCIHGRLCGDLEADARWERALLSVGGGRARRARRFGLICGLPSGFDADSLAGAVGLVAIAEAVLVLATLVVWLMSN